jgi:predicted phage terminase large subunit-like protein
MARTSLISFTEYTARSYQTAPFHRAIAAQLERVEAGDVDRLMLLVPPRHGKSTLASRHFPAWVLGRNPEVEFISVSANADLAADFGRDVRNLMMSPEYRCVFETSLAEDSMAKNKWRTSQSGGYYALGVRGEFMGRGANFLLIDDPFASMADAQSETTRKNVWDWYIGTAYNRLEAGGAVVLINHRMHDEDLSGHIIARASEGGDRFEVVKMPAIDAHGEALWPERYPIEDLQRRRANTIPRYWSALYQQEPVPDTGDYFKRDWLIAIDESKLPPRETLRVYGGSDYAVTADGGDWTVHVVLGLDPDGNPWLLDVWREQSASDVWVDSLCDLVKKWKPIGWAEEHGQIKSGVGPFLERRMRERKAYVAREQFPTRGDKAIRAQSFRGLIAIRGLRMSATAPWRSDVESELLRFPAAVHDDVVDACALVGQLLDRMTAGQKPKPPEKAKSDGYRDIGHAGLDRDLDVVTV